MKIEISRFEIWGLFDEFHHVLAFSDLVSQAGEAKVIVLVGKNGVGKTTMLNMIDEMLQLDFQSFRKIPFSKCVLSLSTGDKLSVNLSEDKSVLHVEFNNNVARLNANGPGAASDEDKVGVENFRLIAKPILQQVSFEKLDIHRSIALRESERGGADDNIFENGERIRLKRRIEFEGKLGNMDKEMSPLSIKVKRFVREAQVDYRKYFSSEAPELFPRILSRLMSISQSTTTTQALISRLNIIKSSEGNMARFGLAMNIADINQLSELLQNKDVSSKSEAAIAALEAYVETLEVKHEERQLIALRLNNFERLMKEFFYGKQILIDYDKGLSILTTSGSEISELQLSSGEYHLLFMMVTALVSTRTGTAIAIDEPELSLHIGWQRNLIKALSECASGASPTFILATHSSAIGAEYQDKWIVLK